MDVCKINFVGFTGSSKLDFKFTPHMFASTVADSMQPVTFTSADYINHINLLDSVVWRDGYQANQ